MAKKNKRKLRFNTAYEEVDFIRQCFRKGMTILDTEKKLLKQFNLRTVDRADFLILRALEFDGVDAGVVGELDKFKSVKYKVYNVDDETNEIEEVDLDEDYLLREQAYDMIEQELKKVSKTQLPYDFNDMTVQEIGGLISGKFIKSISRDDDVIKSLNLNENDDGILYEIIGDGRSAVSLYFKNDLLYGLVVDGSLLRNTDSALIELNRKGVVEYVLTRFFNIINWRQVSE